MTPETYVDHPMSFLTSVGGAQSITKTILHAYGYIPPDPEERQKDFRGDLLRMQQLCDSMGVPKDPLADLEALLDMLDQFVAQGRRVTVAQQTAAEPINRRYVEWCKNVFFESEDTEEYRYAPAL